MVGVLSSRPDGKVSRHHAGAEGFRRRTSSRHGDLATLTLFLTPWKDADPDIPILKKAKAEYAKLKMNFDSLLHVARVETLAYVGEMGLHVSFKTYKISFRWFCSHGSRRSFPNHIFSASN
jgi:hypothetical protein